MVWTPQKLTQEERDLFEKLATTQGEALPKPGKGFFERVKDMFGVSEE
jgi:hypothetical protein